MLVEIAVYLIRSKALKNVTIIHVKTVEQKQNNIEHFVINAEKKEST